MNAEEMASVLSIEQENESFYRHMLTLYTYLFENSKYNIITTYVLWSDVEYLLLQNHIDVIKTYYGRNVLEVDYSNPE